MSIRGRISEGIKLAIALLVSVAGVAVLYGGTAASNESKIDGKVLRADGGRARSLFVIYLRDQADLSAAYGMKNQDARGRYVYETLKSHAVRTQASLKAMLASRGVSNTSFGSRTSLSRRATEGSSKPSPLALT